MKSCILILVFLSILAQSATVTQTDWEDGGGVAGPVRSWGAEFYTSSQVNFLDASLKLNEGETNTVSSDFLGAISVCGVDMDEDGDIDILGAASEAEDVIWWENTDGSGTVWLEHLVVGDFSGAKDVFAADVDGDGDFDVLGAASIQFGSRDLAWWENTDGLGTVWIEHSIEGSFYGAQSVFGADIDGDGDLDVFAAASYLDDISWWENTDGLGTEWTKHCVTDLFNGASRVFVADMDNDGDLDVIGSAIYADEVTWWENITGSGLRWESHKIDENFNCPVSLFAVDVDSDGDMDVLGAAALADDVTWWENENGSGSVWTKHIIDEEFDAAYSVFATDMDGDNDIDVLGAAYLADDITWWENSTGSGDSWVEHTVYGDFDGAASLHSADVNGDGDNDIIGVAHFEDEITWWDVTGYAESGFLESSILDAGDIASWDIFLSNSEEPVGSSISFQFRSSDDSSDMGTWSDTVFSADTPLVGILSENTKYLQYRVILETSDPSISPVLAEVAFSYTYVGIAEGSSAEVDSWSLNALENPSYGLFSALVTVPEAGLVELTLYDVSGRVVSEASQEFLTGKHSISFSGLAEGVYFCTMHAGEFSATERIIVLE